MLIAISTYIKPLTEVDLHRAIHHQYIKPLFEAGKLLVGGRQNPPLGGVIISHVLSRSDFQEILDNDPFTLARVAIYKILEFNPILFSAPFAEILNNQNTV